jgi:hypothetical protein
MPIDDFLKNFTPGDDFDFDKFKAEALAEAEKDRTNANAAITAKDTELLNTKTELEKAQAAAWLAYNNAEAGDAGKQPPAEVDPNSVEEIRKRVFKPLTRK